MEKDICKRCHEERGVPWGPKEESRWQAGAVECFSQSPAEGTMSWHPPAAGIACVSHAPPLDCPFLEFQLVAFEKREPESVVKARMDYPDPDDVRSEVRMECGYLAVLLESPDPDAEDWRELVADGMVRVSRLLDKLKKLTDGTEQESL